MQTTPAQQGTQPALNPGERYAGITTPHDASQPNLKAIRARLDRWELDHLRQVAADTEQKLEDARERIDALEREVSNAWRCAESWQEDAERLVQDLQEAGKAVGLTQAGQLVVVDEQGSAA